MSLTARKQAGHLPPAYVCVWCSRLDTKASIAPRAMTPDAPAPSRFPRQWPALLLGALLGALLTTLLSPTAPADDKSTTFVTVSGFNNAPVQHPDSSHTSLAPSCAPGVPAPAPDTSVRRYLTIDEQLARLYTPEGHHPLSVLDLDPAALAVETHAVQQAIYAHQHPADCSTAKFVVSKGHVLPAGIGSHLHVAGMHLAYALQHGRIFFFGDETGAGWTDNVTCTVRTWECFFRAPTHCPRSLLTAPGADVVEMQYERVADGSMDHRDAPPVFGHYFDRHFPGASKHLRKFWWRGQSVAYLMRLNDAALGHIVKMRTEKSSQRLKGAGRLDVASAATIPLPRGVVHVHIRHGDKGDEMTLQGGKVYADAAEKLAQLHLQTLRREMFVSSEDDAAIAEITTLLPKWEFLWYDLPRSNLGPLAQVNALGADHAATTTLQHLQQLMISLEADAWVGTRASNWNRLIDEFRCTWIARCHNPYEEVGDGWCVLHSAVVCAPEHPHSFTHPRPFHFLTSRREEYGW